MYRIGYEISKSFYEAKNSYLWYQNLADIAHTHKNTKDKPCSDIKGNILVFKMYVHYKISKANPALHTEVGIFRKDNVISLFMFQYVKIIKFIIRQRKSKTM